MNQFDLAQRDAEAAQRLNPDLTGLSTLRGMILEQQGDYDAAETALKKALAMKADDFDAQLYLGSIYYFKRDMDQAKTHLTRALQLQPSSAQARYELALVARADGQLTSPLCNILKRCYARRRTGFRRTWNSQRFTTGFTGQRTRREKGR